MKRKYADRPNWKRVLSRRMLIEAVSSDVFLGHVVMIGIDKVREPLLVDLFGRKQCVVNNGYSWMTLFPHNESYVMTAMFDEQNRIVQWYIDICRAKGFTQTGVPWYDDLYLDIIISRQREIGLIDQDDLQHALEQKIISKEDYDYAYKEADKLLAQLNEKRFALLDYSLMLYPAMLEKLERKMGQRKE